MVTQQLITVPQWNIGEVNYILKVEVYVNNRITTILKEPPRSYISELDNKWIKIFNKYIHCSMKGSQNNIFYDNQNHLGKNKKDIRLIIYDPLECIKKIVNKNKCLKLLRNKNGKLRLNRFIEKCKDKIIPQYIPNSMSSLFFIVYYWKVRESIISYIEQTAGKHIEGLEELKLLFVNKNTMGYDDYINEKAKTLLELDLDNYISDLNKQTEEKRNGK